MVDYKMKVFLHSIFILLTINNVQAENIKDCLESSLRNLINTVYETSNASCNGTTFCTRLNGEYFLSKNGTCFCFISLPSNFCENKTGKCKPCKKLLFDMEIKVENCTYKAIQANQSCIFHTIDCGKNRAVLCYKESTTPVTDISTVPDTSTISDISTVPDTSISSVPYTSNSPVPVKSPVTGISPMVMVVVVMLVVLVAIITVVTVILIFKNRNRSMDKTTRISTNMDPSNSCMPNLYDTPNYVPSNKCASEYDYIQESDINQNAKYNVSNENRCETMDGTSNDLGNNYFILEPQNKTEDQVAIDVDDDGDYVDKDEGDYHHLNEKLEKKSTLSNEDHLYDHGQNSKKNDNLYDTTNVINDTIDKTEYNTIDSVKDDGTYNTLA